MDSEMKKYINVLERLSYILECVILECVREAKTELGILCKRMETDDNYQIEPYSTIYDGLREVIDTYQMRKYREAASILSRTTRQAWEIFLKKDFMPQSDKEYP